jgi:uncharacterized protein (TIGR03437 family)
VLKPFVVGFISLPFSIAIVFAQTPVITPGGTVNGASFEAGKPVAAGSLVSIFGSQFAAGLALADTVPLNTNLAGTSVSFNGITAPLDFVSSGQINAQVPFEVLSGGTGAVNVVVTRNGVPSAADPVIINTVAPGVFYDQGTGYAIAYFGLGSDPRFGKLAAPPGTFPQNPNGTTTAHPGDILTVYATGLGALDKPILSGHDSSDALRNTVATPTVLIGNVQAQLFFSGLTAQFPGVYQLNIGVPSVPTGTKVPLQIQIGGITSPPIAFIAVANP